MVSGLANVIQPGKSVLLFILGSITLRRGLNWVVRYWCRIQVKEILAVLCVQSNLKMDMQCNKAANEANKRLSMINPPALALGL